jgi:hypothetical protein
LERLSKLESFCPKDFRCRKEKASVTMANILMAGVFGLRQNVPLKYFSIFLFLDYSPASDSN